MVGAAYYLVRCIPDLPRRLWPFCGFLAFDVIVAMPKFPCARALGADGGGFASQAQCHCFALTAGLALGSPLWRSDEGGGAGGGGRCALPGIGVQRGRAD